MKTGILYFSKVQHTLTILLLGILLNLGNVQAQKSITVTNNDGSNSKQKLEQILEKNLDHAIEKSSQLSSCNFFSEIEISNLSEDDQPVDEVGCSNNDTLQICIRILQFETSTPGNGCQYLHGLVPEWGCLTPLQQSPEGEPGAYTVPMTNNTGIGQWLWYPEGVVTYNQPGGFYDPFEPVGAGWFYTFAPGNLPFCQDYSNPNCTWGDGVGCNSNGFVWEVCFLAELGCVELDLDAGPNPCTFSFRTFSDGETGGYDVMGCQDDQPYEYSFIGECCDEPIVLNDTLDFEICSGDEFQIDFISNMDPETTYDWVVIPNPNGATSGSGTAISQVLTNTTAAPVTVTYFVTPTCAMGCVGETFTVNVTINPAVNVQADDFFGSICDFECVPISAMGSEGVPPYSYQWSDGQNASNIVVCPFPGFNIYTVTITDSNGCTDTDDVFIEVFESPVVAISAPSLEDCNSVTLTADVIFGGSGNYFYKWSNGGTSQSITVTNSGNYSVVVIDAYSDCESFSESVTVIIHEELPAPVINCTSTISSITFFWDEVPGATGYLLDGNDYSGSSYTVSGLNPGETVSITLEAISAGICPNVSSTTSCTTEPCGAIFIDVSDVGTVCEDEPAFDIMVNILGGSGSATGFWNGAGIINPIAGTFDPTIAGAGTHTLIYQVFEGPCLYEETLIIEVIDATSESLNISCFVTTDAVTFSWNAIAGVSEYLVNGNLQSGTSFVINTVPGEEVNITVETVGAGLCGEVSDSQSCQAEDCPTLDIFLNAPNDICLDVGPITLQASEPNGTWSGPCIIDSENGVFDPSLGQPGVNTITYILSIGQCVYSNSININVEEPLEQPTISCSSTLDQVSFSWAEVSGATGYLVNGNFQSETVFSENVGPGETVTITVEAISNNSCPSTIASASCTSEECEGGLVLTPVGPICQDNGLLLLEANISGGLWSGPGVIDPFSGTFDPIIAQQGIHTITYIINTGPCDAEVTMEIEVQIPLNSIEIACSPSTESVTFVWTPIDGVSSYLVNGTSQTSTSISIDGEPGESISITVEAISDGPCPNSISSLSCEVDNCPSVSIVIPPVENICLGETPLNTINLEVEVEGTSEAGIWSGIGIVDPVNGIFDPNIASLGSHQLTYQIQNGTCSFNQSTSVQIGENPIVEAGNPITLTCADPVLSLAGAGQGTILWEGPGVIFGGDALAPLVNAEGIYTITIIDPISECAATDVVEVFEDKEVPVAMASEDQLITCEAEEVPINSIGNIASNLVVEWNGPGINSNNENVSTTMVDVPGIYMLRIRNESNGCVSEPDSITVLQNTIPPSAEVQLIGALDCSGNAVVIESQQEAGVNYSWMIPSGLFINDENSIEVVEAGTVTIFATSTINGCSASQFFMLENNQDIPIANAGEDQEITCVQPEIILDGSNSDSGNNFTYEWTSPTGIISSPNNFLTLSTQAAGMYILEVTDLTNDCKSLDTVMLALNTILPEVEAGPDQELGCNDTNLGLTGVISDEVDGVVWRDENDNVVATVLNTLIETPGWYHLTATNLDNGCVGVDSLLITIDEDVPYAIEVATESVTCYGDKDGVIEINNISGGKAPYQYAIGSVSYVELNFRDNLEGGTYEVSVMDADGCVFSENVVVPEQTEMSLNLGDEIITDLGEEHIIDAQMGINIGAVESVVWTPEEEVKCLDENCLEVSLSPMNTTVFQMMVMDTSGCMAEAELQVRLVKQRQVYFPNIFTPNDDGFNDRFYIQGKAEKIKAVRKFLVMDRWGSTVYQDANFDLNDSTYGWDGSLKGRKVQPGVFVYFAEIEFIDGHVEMFKGEVTMVY